MEGKIWKYCMLMSLDESFCNAVMSFILLFIVWTDVVDSSTQKHFLRLNLFNWSKVEKSRSVVCILVTCMLHTGNSYAF